MSRNGSGVYSLPAGSTVSNGDTSDATDLNTPLADLEADANTARPIVAGGTGATSVSGAQTALKIAPTDSTATITGTWTYTGTLDISGGTLTAPDGFVTSAKLADDAVTLAKIADANLAGADSTLLTGTAGTDGNLAQWNADGDLVDGPGELTQDQVEDDTDTTFGTISGERLGQFFAANEQQIGVGQTWQDVSGSRSPGTTYTNDTGKPIMAFVRASVSGSADVEVINGASTLKIGEINNAQMHTSFIIPDGSGYRLQGGTVTIEEWTELR